MQAARGGRGGNKGGRGGRARGQQVEDTTSEVEVMVEVMVVVGGRGRTVVDPWDLRQVRERERERYTAVLLYRVYRT